MRASLVNADAVALDDTRPPPIDLPPLPSPGAYQLGDDGAVIEVATAAVFVPDAETRHAVLYRAWLAAGNRPLPAAVKPRQSVLRVADFLARFTEEEEAAIWVALASRPAILGQMLRRIADGTIDLAGSDALSLIAALVGAGVVDQARADAILTP